MFAANNTGEIYSLLDTDGDRLEDHAELFCNVADDGLRSPAGLVFKGRDLYVGTAQEVRIYTDTNGDGKADESRTFFDNIPHSEHPYEYTSALTFGPDDYLYLVLTTDSWNAGASPDPDGWRGAILRISPDGKEVERFATGVRSVPAMAFNEYGDLLFVDNAGGGNPTEELNVALHGHFYGHNPAKYDHPSVTDPLYDLQTEIAPAGMVYNPAHNDFDGTGGDLFIAFYGPGERWNRGAIGRFRIEALTDGGYRIREFPAVTGIPKISDLEFGANGDLYVAQVGKTDYWYQSLEEADGAFYRLIHVSWIEADPIDGISTEEQIIASESALERGKQLFAERACSACHSVDGRTELLGPNLKSVGQSFSKQEILDKVKAPSKHITPGMRASRITQKNGEVLLGRVINTDEEQVHLMIVGNRIVDIDRADILTEEPHNESLMYEGLLIGLSEEDVDALLSYLVHLHQVNEDVKND
jgi:putative heme-binding domain-containing protein